MKITVIVPTYLRPSDLSNCLESLKCQTRPLDEVLVIVRDTDSKTWEFLDNFDRQGLPIQTQTVTKPGVIAAMNQGLKVATGDIICFTDDDATPYPDWSAKIETHFLENPQVAGVGGRDRVYHGTELESGEQERVGKLLWFGKVIGNHHLGVGTAREVDILKGVNMSYRRTVIANSQFDERLKGSGAQVHFEIGFCLNLKKGGWKLIYDPDILVNHYVAQRFDEDQRNQFNFLAFTNAVHNETLALLDNLSTPRQVIFLLWSILIGTKKSFGLLQFFRFFPQESTLAIQKLQASWLGRWQGLRTYQNSKKINKEINKMQLETTIKPYIEGKEFKELIRMKIEQKGSVQDRMDLVENLVTGKRVIHVGCLDHLPIVAEKMKSDRWFHGRLTKVAETCLGVDINQEGIKWLQEKYQIDNIIYGDLESGTPIPEICSQKWDFIVFGEILEHVNNPVNFLHQLVIKYQSSLDKIILTVPNAFRAGNIKGAFQNTEIINTDHRYWFSPYTIWKIIEQAGLELEDMYMCQFTPTQGFQKLIKNIILQRYPLMAEDIVVICKIK